MTVILDRNTSLAEIVLTHRHDPTMLETISMMIVIDLIRTRERIVLILRPDSVILGMIILRIVILREILRVSFVLLPLHLTAHRDLDHFEVLQEGEQMMVRIYVARLRARFAKSLSVRQMDPYIIMRRIEANIYVLDILASTGIHPIFSVEDMTSYYEPRQYAGLAAPQVEQILVLTEIRLGVSLDVICRSIAGNGGIDIILKYIDNCDEAGDKMVPRACCSLLSKVMSIITVLCLRSPDNAARAVEAGAGDLAIQAMQKFPSVHQLQRQSCSMIRNLVARNPENRCVSMGLKQACHKREDSIVIPPSTLSDFIDHPIVGMPIDFLLLGALHKCKLQCKQMEVYKEVEASVMEGKGNSGGSVARG
ncbi:hypothetical protein KSP40_PGU022503 [Platanthera guangdongensis]|uniref:Uncharacterized protein n=1 Tax=Platanthera guangdongensis TaxID=2320717 RepID=A0ABR2LIH1_9ASPA